MMRHEYSGYKNVGKMYNQPYIANSHQGLVDDLISAGQSLLTQQAGQVLQTAAEAIGVAPPPPVPAPAPPPPAPTPAQVLQQPAPQPMTTAASGPLGLGKFSLMGLSLPILAIAYYLFFHKGKKMSPLILVALVFFLMQQNKR